MIFSLSEVAGCRFMPISVIIIHTVTMLTLFHVGQNRINIINLRFEIDKLLNFSLNSSNMFENENLSVMPRRRD